MTQILNDPLETLRSGMSGTVIGPDDSDYDAARLVWNAAVDRRPAVIVRPSDARDVAAAVGYAVAEGLEIAVRGGGHSMSGAGTVDAGLVIDLSRMRGVDVDPVARTARVQGGALLGDLDAATQQHGLAAPSGIVSHTGVGGLALGGGMGQLSRLAGLTIDHLRSAELVTADGRIRRISPTEDPDLFWAIRGGGGNFGVVTEFELGLVPVGPIVQLGLLFWELDQGAEVLRLARNLIPGLPRDLNVMIIALNAPPAPFVPPEHQGAAGWALEVVGFGSPDEHAAVLGRIRTALPPAWELATPMPYTALQSMLDEANAVGQHDYDRSVYLDELSDGAIAVLDEEVRHKRSPGSIVAFYRLDGAYSAVAEDATAFGGSRQPCYAVFAIAVCPTAEVLVEERQWVRDLSEALTPFARAGAYVNGITDGTPDQVKASYGGAKWQRLREVKSAVDPRNVFHRNHNIPPLS